MLRYPLVRVGDTYLLHDVLCYPQVRVRDTQVFIVRV